MIRKYKNKITFGIFILILLGALSVGAIYSYKIKGNTQNINSNSQVVPTLSPTPSQTVNILPTLSPTNTPSPTIYDSLQKSNTPSTQSGDPALWTVDRYISIGNYAPPSSDLVLIDGKYVSKRIINDLNNLKNDAKLAGINLKVVSGYRSYIDQVQTFNYWVDQEMQNNPNLTKQQATAKANTYSALPGHSEHQLGTTVDILSDETNYQFNSDGSLPYAKWLATNASKYHFTISYPPNNGQYNYEPWHIRWRPS